MSGAGAAGGLEVGGCRGGLSSVCPPLPPRPSPGDCQGLPRFSFAEPSGAANELYPVGSQVPYRCRPGYTGVGGKSFLVTCLPNSTWAWDPDFCIGECPPGRLPWVIRGSR